MLLNRWWVTYIQIMASVFLIPARCIRWKHQWGESSRIRFQKMRLQSHRARKKMVLGCLEFCMFVCASEENHKSTKGHHRTKIEGGFSVPLFYPPSLGRVKSSTFSFSTRSCQWQWLDWRHFFHKLKQVYIVTFRFGTRWLYKYS